MNKTLNGSYKDHDQAKNTWDDLIATGIPRDNIFIDANRKRQATRESCLPLFLNGLQPESGNQVLQVAAEPGQLAAGAGCLVR